MADQRLAGEVELRLAGLVHKELIRPHPATLSGDEAFRFRHLLIRDAAYDGMPKATRAELHRRFARWLEQNAGDLSELDEIAGWHLEQATRYGRELGASMAPDLARDAAAHLRTAGDRAFDRGTCPRRPISLAGRLTCFPTTIRHVLDYWSMSEASRPRPGTSPGRCPRSTSRSPKPRRSALKTHSGERASARRGPVPGPWGQPGGKPAKPERRQRGRLTNSAMSLASPARGTWSVSLGSRAAGRERPKSPLVRRLSTHDGRRACATRHRPSPGFSSVLGSVRLPWRRPCRGAASLLPTRPHVRWRRSH